MDGVFEYWKMRARGSREHRILFEGIQGAIHHRMVSNSLQTWTQRVVEIRSREVSAVQAYETRLVSRFFGKWSLRLARIGNNESLMESLIQVREEDLVRGTFRHWSNLFRRKRLLEKRLQDKLDEDRRMLLLGCLDRWHDRYREGILAEEEEQILRYRQDQTLRAFFAGWQDRTMVRTSSWERCR